VEVERNQATDFDGGLTIQSEHIASIAERSLGCLESWVNAPHPGLWLTRAGMATKEAYILCFMKCVCLFSGTECQSGEGYLSLRRAQGWCVPVSMAQALVLVTTAYTQMNRTISRNMGVCVSCHGRLTNVSLAEQPRMTLVKVINTFGKDRRVTYLNFRIRCTLARKQKFTCCNRMRFETAYTNFPAGRSFFQAKGGVLNADMQEPLLRVI
jgi:cytochrome c553